MIGSKTMNPGNDPEGRSDSGPIAKALGLSETGFDKHFPSKSGGGNRRFRVALSFAGAHEAFIAELAGYLADELGREHILYYRFFEAEFAQVGRDVGLPNDYLQDSDLIAVFLSEHYPNSTWCRREWRYIRTLIETPEQARIMLLRFDQTNALPEFGILDSDVKISIGSRSAAEIGDLILQRLHLFTPDDETTPPDEEVGVDPAKSIGIFLSQEGERLGAGWASAERRIVTTKCIALAVGSALRGSRRVAFHFGDPAALPNRAIKVGYASERVEPGMAGDDAVGVDVGVVTLADRNHPEPIPIAPLAIPRLKVDDELFGFEVKDVRGDGTPRATALSLRLRRVPPRGLCWLVEATDQVPDLGTPIIKPGHGVVGIVTVRKCDLTATDLNVTQPVYAAGIDYLLRRFGT